MRVGAFAFQAKAEIEVMGKDDESYRYEEKYKVVDSELFGSQEEKSD